MNQSRAERRGASPWLVATGRSLLLLALSFTPLEAATLRIRFTLPTDDNSGSCVSPALIPMGTNPALKGHWRYWVAGGDSLGGAVEDSLSGLPGAVVLRDYPVANGLYRVRAWATDAGGVGCDTLLTKSPFKSPPWKPLWLP